MLGRPPIHVLESMRRLRAADSDFAALLAWLESERATLDRTLTTHRDQWVVAQHQGAVQVLDKLSEYVEASRR